MQTMFSTDYQCQFLIGPANDPATGTPAKLGALVAKRTWQVNGSTLTPAAAQEPITTADDPQAAPFRYESDLVLVKAKADLIVLDPAHVVDPPGVTYTVTRSGTGEALTFVVPAAHYQPILGWRDRTTGTRLAQAGDAANFHPSPQQLVPNGFDNRFLNGMVDPLPFSPWTSGETITITRAQGGPAVPERTLTLPASAPTATLVYSAGATTRTLQPPMRHDTIVLHVDRSVCLTVWRATWRWNAPEGTPITDADYVRLEVS